MKRSPGRPPYDEIAIKAQCQRLLPIHVATVAARNARTGHTNPWSWYSGVYFIACEGFIKIGFAADVRSRLRAYRVSVPFEPIPLGYIETETEAHARALEQALHECFAAFRLGRREWFRDDVAIRDYITYHVGRWPVPKARAT